MLIVSRAALVVPAGQAPRSEPARELCGTLELAPDSCSSSSFHSLHLLLLLPANWDARGMVEVQPPQESPGGS